jgi:hypothetical protein
MLRFYTADREGTLREGQTIELVKHSDLDPPFLQQHVDLLFPEGVTRFGDRYFLNSQMPGGNVEGVIELAFEYVRRSHFPSRPSRFQSLFAATSMSAAESFARHHDGRGCPIWEIAVDHDQVHRADMRLLTLASSLLVVSYRAHLYWRGEPGEPPPPTWEYLVAPPIRMVKRVS